MSQSIKKTTTTRRQSGSFVYPQQTTNMGVGVSVGIASTAILSNTTDFAFKGIMHLHKPIEAIVHIIGQGGAGGGTGCGRGGGGGGGGYIRAKIDNINGKKFIATVTTPSPAPTSFWFNQTEYVSATRGNPGGGGGGDNDPGRCLSCPGGSGGGGGGTTVHPTTTIFTSLQSVSGGSGSGGSSTGGCDHAHHGPPGAGGNSAFFNTIGPSHPFAPQYGFGRQGDGGAGQDGVIIVETPGRPAQMRGGGYPSGGYNLS